MAGGCSPLPAGFEVTGRDDDHSTVTMAVRADEPVFAGHYPGFPIFPGVCIIEHVRRGALATVPDRDHRSEWDLAEIAGARFLSPVFPGDKLIADLAWTREGTSWWCRGMVVTQRGIAAKVKLRLAERRPL